MATLLVVDDEPHMRLLAFRVLSKAGYQVLQATDGIEAIEMVAKHSIDLVLCDIAMPRMGGLEVVKVLKEQKGPPIVIMSAHTSQEDQVKAEAEGADAFLGKPFKTDELLSLLERFLAKPNKN